MRPIGSHATVVVSTTAIGLTVPDGATHVLYTVGVARLNARFDGGDPTSSVGHELSRGASGLVDKAAAEKLRFIREGATDGRVAVQGFAY